MTIVIMCVDKYYESITYILRIRGKAMIEGHNLIKAMYKIKPSSVYKTIL